MNNLTILAGGYTSFISSYNFNPSAGTLTLLSQSPAGAESQIGQGQSTNPSWIAAHPTNKSILYAVNEVLSGALQSFLVDLDGTLTGPIDQVSTGGNGPAFAGCLSTGQVAAANFGDGTGKIIPTASDPLYFAQDAPTIVFPPPDGGVSHPHMALEHGGEVFIPDLVSINTLVFSLRHFVSHVAVSLTSVASGCR
jgi:6-phosphogluconolactonase (cycloisomerase 2 family)